MTERRVTIAGVHRALERFDLDPTWENPISIVHRCPGCGAACTTIEYELGYFASACDRCPLTGPGGFEEMTRLAVQHAKRGAA